MNPINYSDIFDFSNASEPEKFVKAVNEMEKALADLQNKAAQAAAQATKVLQANATAAAAAAQKVTQATQAEIEALAKQAAALQKANDEAKKGKEAADDQARTLGELRKQLSQLSAAYDVNANNVEDMNRAIKETTQQIKLNQQAIRAAQADTQNATKIDIQALQTYNQKSQALNQLRARYRDLNPAIASQRQEMEKLLVKIQLLDKELKDTDASLGNFQRNVGNYRSALAGIAGALPGASAFAPMIAGGGGAAAAVGALVAAVGSIVAVTARAQESIIRFQGLQKAIKAVSDTTVEADTNMQFLFTEADRLGLSVTDLSDSFKSFMASAKGTSLQGEEARKVFSAVSAASAALGLSSDNTNRALTALGQMLSKGKVQAEELRGQLGEALPGAFNLAAKAMGVTTNELGKMMERGEVLATDLLPKLAEVLQQEYGGSEATGLQASINRMNNAFDAFFVNIGTRLEPFLKSTYDQIAGFVNSVNRLMETPEQRMQEATQQRAQNIRDFMQERGTTSVQDYTKALAEVTEQQRKFNETDAKALADLEKRYQLLLTAKRPAAAAIARTKQSIEALKQRKEGIAINVKAIQQILVEDAQAQINIEKQKNDKLAADKAAADEKRKKDSEKAAKEEAKRRKKEIEDAKKREQEFRDFLFSISDEMLAARMQTEAAFDVEAAAAKIRVQLEEAARNPLNIQAPTFKEEKAASPFSLFSFTELEQKDFDDFTDFQLSLIDNNKMIAETFAAVGRQLDDIFGDNPFTQFLQQAIQGYQAFLKVQELGIILKKKDTAATAANTSAAVTNAGAQGAAAVTKTAAQSGIGALATVPAVLAVITAAVGLIKGLFAGFEEGTEFLGKDNARAPLGKDSIPIIAAKGERILSYKHNAQLGNISNEDLVKYAKLGMLQGDLQAVGRPAVVVAKQENNAGAIAKAVASEIGKLPVTVNVWDEKGYHAHTEKMSNLRRVNKKWFA